ncbi:MAG: sugar phosphate isomerase/epimerase family protein [Bryobacteraceae bacterium]
MPLSNSQFSRRELFGAALASSLASPLASPAAASGAASANSQPLPICAFSKHFQWTTVPDLAKMAAELGYDGIDLTVRAGGHVEPDRVAEDLPRAFEAVRAAGLTMPMVTAGIIDARSPYAGDILKTCASLGIRLYRWGGFRYNYDQPIAPQLDGFRARSRELAALNRRYGVCAMYHTHSGPREVGGPIWDLWEIIRDLDHSALSINYDIGHATVEGGYGGWRESSRLALPLMKGTAFKDFNWGKNSKGEWQPQWCALGKGMVNFREYMTILKTGGFSGPLQLHFEYPDLGGANNGARHMTISRDQFLSVMRRDMAVFKTLLRESGLRS